MKLVKRVGPFIESKLSTNKIRFNILIALIPIIIFTFYKKGIVPYQEYVTDIINLLWPILSLVIALSISFIIELLFQIIVMKRRKKEDILYDIKHNYSFIPPILVVLIMPYGVNLPILITGVIGTTLIGKLLFGGFGNNTFNPALIGILCVIAIFSGSYQNLSIADEYSKYNEIREININIGEDEFEAPYTSIEYLSGDIQGSSADISSILCLIALIYLMITKSIKWRIPISYICTLFILSTIIGFIAFNDLTHGIFQILAGGTLFYAVFIAPDSVTTPVTRLGQTLLGISLGILTVIFRFLTPYFYEAIIFSVIILNLFTKLFDKIGIKLKYQKLLKES